MIFLSSSCIAVKQNTNVLRLRTIPASEPRSHSVKQICLCFQGERWPINKGGSELTRSTRTVPTATIKTLLLSSNDLFCVYETKVHIVLTSLTVMVVTNYCIMEAVIIIKEWSDMRASTTTKKIRFKNVFVLYVFVTQENNF